MVVMFQAQNTETINTTWKVAVSFKIIMQAWAQPKKKFQDKNFHKFQDKFQDTWQVVGRSHAQTRVDNGHMYGPRISKL